MPCRWNPHLHTRFDNPDALLPALRWNLQEGVASPLELAALHKTLQAAQTAKRRAESLLKDKHKDMLALHQRYTEMQSKYREEQAARRAEKPAAAQPSADESGALKTERELRVKAREELQQAKDALAAAGTASDEWLSNHQHLQQLELLLPVAMASVQAFTKHWREQTTTQQKAGKLAAEAVLVRARNIARLNATQPGTVITAAPKSKAEINDARYALHPDKWVRAPRFLATLITRASAVVNSAADYVNGML